MSKKNDESRHARLSAVMQKRSKPQEVFDVSREIVGELLRERGMLPGGKASLSPALAESVLGFLATDDEPTNELIRSAAIVLAKLRVGLLGTSDPRGQHAARLLSNIGQEPFDPTTLVAAGYELRSMLESSKAPSTGQGYTDALVFYFRFTATNGGKDPTAQEMYDYLSTKGHGEPNEKVKSGNFPKTYRRWRRKWRALDVAHSLAELTGL